MIAPRSGRMGVRLCALALVASLLAGCGSPPPDVGTLVRQTSDHMKGLRGFHFTLAIQGATPTVLPVQSAEGDARPPDLTASVQLAQNGVLLEVDLVVSGGRVFLKSFTGGWQELTAAEVTQFFDVHALFDPQIGLFSAMAKTSHLGLGSQESIDGHQTWRVTGRLPGAQVHDLLSVARAEPTYTTTYWIEAPQTLWRAKLTGRLFDPLKEATITFDFSQHDHPVTVTPPPLG